MKRAFFCLVWSVVFFFGAAFAFSLAAVSAAGNDPVKQKQIAQESGKKWGPLALLGSIGAAVVLGAAGLLPGTRRRQRTDSEPNPSTHGSPSRSPYNQPTASEPNPTAQSSLLQRTYQPTAEAQSPLLQRTYYQPTGPSPSGIQPSEHAFTLLGYFDRWQRVLPGTVVFIGFGLFLLASPEIQRSNAPYAPLVFVGLGFAAFVKLAARSFGVRWARIDADGVSWGGVLGSGFREWNQVTDVYREERLTNRRYRTRELRLKFDDGASVTFDQALTGYDRLAETVQAVTSSLLMPLKRQELRAEGKVGFGPVTVRTDGIKMKGRSYSWDGLSRYRIENGHIVLYSRLARRAGHRDVPLREVPNYVVLLNLMEECGVSC
jgi:hypothetical protein